MLTDDVGRELGAPLGRLGVFRSDLELTALGDELSTLERTLDGLIERVREAAEHNLALSGEDLQLLLNALLMLAQLQARMSDQDITLHKLRKLAGIVNASEKLSVVLPPADKV